VVTGAEEPEGICGRDARATCGLSCLQRRRKGAAPSRINSEKDRPVRSSIHRPHLELHIQSSQTCDSDLQLPPDFLESRTSGTPTFEFLMCDLALIFSEVAPIFSDAGVPHVGGSTSGTPTFQKISPVLHMWNSEVGVAHLKLAVTTLRASTSKVRGPRWRTATPEFQMCKFCRNCSEWAC